MNSEYITKKGRDLIECAKQHNLEEYIDIFTGSFYFTNSDYNKHKNDIQNFIDEQVDEDWIIEAIDDDDCIFDWVLFLNY